MSHCKIKTLSIFNYFFLILISISFSHAFLQPQLYQVLDVSNSIAKAHNLFSDKALQNQENDYEPNPTFSSTSRSSPPNNTVLSVSLHPWISITKQPLSSYRNLTLTRLARDSVHVNMFYKRLNLEPVDKIYNPYDLESPLTSGFSQGSGEYFARIGIGQPAQSYYMVVDTGSDISWLQCQPCSDCYEQSDPIYNPSTSSTYRPLECTSPECSSLSISACGSTGCLYEVHYGDGSYTTGDFAVETLTFGNSGRVENTAIGCGHENQGLFTGSAGLLGMGGSSLSLPSQIKASSFSYCLVHRDSTAASTLEFNSAFPGDSVVATLIRNPNLEVFFYVDLVGITVGGEKLPIKESVFQLDGSGHGGVIIDSGTSVTRLMTEAYNTLRDTYLKYTQNLPKSDGYSLFDTCYDLSSLSQATVPKVAFLFAGGQTLTLNPENCLIPVDDNGKFCLAFATSGQPVNIIGNVQQQSTRVSYDLANRQIAFSLNKC